MMPAPRRYFVVISFDAHEEHHRTRPRQSLIHNLEKLVRASLPGQYRAPLAWNGHDDNGWPSGGRHEATFLYEGPKGPLTQLRLDVFDFFDNLPAPSLDLAVAIQACKMVRSRTSGRSVRNEEKR